MYGEGLRKVLKGIKFNFTIPAYTLIYISSYYLSCAADEQSNDTDLL